MMVVESKSRTVWVGKGDGEGASFCSARGTIHGLQKWASMCAEPLRSKLGAVVPRRHPCSHTGAPESLLRDNPPPPPPRPQPANPTPPPPTPSYLTGLYRPPLSPCPPAWEVGPAEPHFPEEVTQAQGRDGTRSGKHGR